MKKQQFPMIYVEAVVAEDHIVVSSRTELHAPEGPKTYNMRLVGDPATGERCWICDCPASEFERYCNHLPRGLVAVEQPAPPKVLTPDMDEYWARPVEPKTAPVVAAQADDNLDADVWIAPARAGHPSTRPPLEDLFGDAA